MTHLQITDITGRRWIGDSSDEALTEDERAGVAELLSDFKDLTHISLEIGGAKHYFNPAHIIAAALIEVS